MQSIRKLFGAFARPLRPRRSAPATDELEIELSHDEWSQYRRDRRVPLCIATKHLRT